jgi:hypothetical protein
MADEPKRKRERPAITCPRCSLTSYLLQDVAERYCVNCDRWHDSPGYLVPCNAWEDAPGELVADTRPFGERIEALTASITLAEAAKLLGVELSDPPGPLERLQETIDQLSIDLSAFTDEQLAALGPAERRLITEARRHIREYELAKENGDG